MISVPISLIFELSEYGIRVQHHRQQYHQTLEHYQAQGIFNVFLVDVLVTMATLKIIRKV